MATLIAGREATPGEPGTRTPAGGDEGLPGRRSRGHPEHGAQAPRRGDGFSHGRVPVRPESRT